MYKRILASMAIVTFAAAMAVAQSSSSSGSYPSQSSSPSAQPSASQQSSPDQPSAQSSTPNQPSSTDQTSGTQSTTTNTTSTTTTTAKTGKEKTVRGCIVQQASDFYLQPVKGHKGLIKLNSSEDLKAHVGHEVKVTGTESKIAAGASASTSGGEMASNNQSGTSASGNASSMPQSDVNGSANASREIQVSKIDMVSDTCSIKSDNNTSNSPSGTGNTTPPPQK